MALYKNLAGKTLGRLTAIEYIKPSKWSCLCSCGNSVVVPAHNLLNGTAKSCGCIRTEKLVERRKSHGMTNTPTYIAWCNMKQRCYKPDWAGYKNYGARGITVCDRWTDSFENFLADMGVRPDGFSLDRVDSNGNYDLDNCRWVDWSTQMNNQRKTVLMTKDGITLSRSQWARKLGIKVDLIRARQKSGMTDEEALTT